MLHRHFHAAMDLDADGWWQPAAAPDETVCWLFDLGQDHTCQGWAEIEGAGGDESLLISYAEKIRTGSWSCPTRRPTATCG